VKCIDTYTISSYAVTDTIKKSKKEEKYYTEKKNEIRTFLECAFKFSLLE